MDCLQKKQQAQLNCSKHPDNEVVFIQFKEIQQDKHLFYCQICLDDDEEFKTSNYISTKKILQSNDHQLIDKWPPLQDNSLHKKIQECLKQNNQKSSLFSKIESYFENLKSETIHKIEQIKKKMMSQCESFPNNSDDVLDKFRELSQIDTLKQILFESNINNKQKENKFRKFILDFESKKKKNTEIMNSLLEQHQFNQNLIDFEIADKIKCQISQLIDQINIFTLDKDLIHSINNQFKENNKKVNTNLILDLISTKSNYCSQTFLEQIKSLLSQMSPLIEKAKIEQFFMKDKKPIDFSKINNDYLDQINEFSEHFSRLSSKSEEYVNEMKNCVEIKQIMSVVNKKQNNIKKEYLVEFEKYLIETYPALTKIKQNSIFEQNQQIQQQNNHTYIDILPQIQMIKTNFRQSQQIQIKKNENNSIQISQNFIDWTNCVSDILDENANYIFRFQLIHPNLQKQCAMIGLVTDSTKNSQLGYADKLSCYFCKYENKFYYGGHGIDKKEKGNFNVLDWNQNEIEMRVCISKGILQILDYPHYNHILSVTDENKNNLMNYKNLRLYIGLGNYISVQLFYASKMNENK